MKFATDIIDPLRIDSNDDTAPDFSSSATSLNRFSLTKYVNISNYLNDH